MTLSVLPWWGDGASRNLGRVSATGVAPSKMRLLELLPDLGEHLSPEERALIWGLFVPTVRATNETVDVDALLEDRAAFAGVMVEGLLLHRMAIGGHHTLRLLGPGDIVIPSPSARPTLVSDAGYRAAGPVAIAPLDDRALLAMRHFPRLFGVLQSHLGEAQQRLATQLAICQLPRVEDRLLAVFWLFAEAWGRVTPSGTVVPLTLTHDALGELVGARRPTVSLALKELATRGALVRQDDEWLLLEVPPGAGEASATIAAEPALVSGHPSGWRLAVPDAEPASGEAAGSDAAYGPEAPSSFNARSAWRSPDRGRSPQPVISGEELLAAVRSLRATHVHRTEDVASRLGRSRQLRGRSELLRQRIAGDRLSRTHGRALRPAP